jgi:hypothetical protein
MGSLFKTWLRASVLRKGGNSPLWTFIGVMGVLNALRKRVSGGKQTNILNSGIRPGEIIEIRHTGVADKKLLKERSQKAALVAQYQAAEQLRASGGKLPRRTRKLHMRLASGLVPELAKGNGLHSGANAPVGELLATAAAFIGATTRPLSRKSRRRAAKVTRKSEVAARKSSAKAAKFAASRAGRRAAKYASRAASAASNSASRKSL